MLEQLSVDNPTWTLADVIAHLNGSDGHHFDGGIASPPETDIDDSLAQPFYDETIEPLDLLDYADSLNNDNSFNVGFHLSGISQFRDSEVANRPEGNDCLKRALSSSSALDTSFMSPSPQLPSNSNLQYSTLFPDICQWPAPPTTFLHPQFKLDNNDFNVPLFPPFQVLLISSVSFSNT